MKDSRHVKNKPNFELASIVLGILGGALRKVHTEEVAKKCHELYPDRFSWTRYPEFPDKDVVRSALMDARKEKYGAHVKGRSGRGRGKATAQSGSRGTDGWTLTEAGIEAFKKVGSDFEIDKQVSNKSRNPSVRRLKALRGHKLWARFLHLGDQLPIDRVDLADLLRCRVDAPTSVWTARFDRLEQDILGLAEKDVLPFLDVLRSNFETMDGSSW